MGKSQSQSYITTDSQSASLSWCQAPICYPRPVVPILSLIIFGQLRVCWCEAPSLTRSRVCTFQFLPSIVNAAFLRSESHGTHDHILLSLFLRLLQPGGSKGHSSCPHYLPQGGLYCRHRSHAMLGWSLITTACRVLRLQEQETASSYGGQLQMYWISSRWQMTSGGPPAWGLGVGLTTLHLNEKACLEMSQRASDLGRILWINDRS
jgi:hypothetical protein